MEKINYQLADKIKKNIRSDNKPLIIGISGVNGVGKTTIAFHLSNILEIKQRIGLGTIVKTIIALHPTNNDFLKMDNDFSSPFKIRELRKQAKILSKPINLIISKYESEKVSCIIEGVQLLPRYLNKGFIHFHVAITDTNKYKQQLQNCDTRKPRKVSDKEISNLLTIDKILKKEMNVSEVHSVDNSQSLITILNKLLEYTATYLHI